MATMKDVARLAGVSHGTVSNVVNGAKNVSVDKIKKVEAAMKELGYTPNTAARNLKKEYTNQIDLVIPNLITGEFLALYESIRFIADTKNYAINLKVTDGIAQKERDLLNQSLMNNVDGVILTTCQPANTAFFSDIMDRGLKILFFMSDLLGSNCSYVGLDLSAILEDILFGLFQEGKRVALITGEADSTYHDDLISTYVRLTSGASSSSVKYSEVIQINPEFAARGAAQIFQLDPIPDVVIASNEKIALEIHNIEYLLSGKTSRMVDVITLNQTGNIYISFDHSIPYPQKKLAKAAFDTMLSIIHKKNEPTHIRLLVSPDQAPEDDPLPSVQIPKKAKLRILLNQSPSSDAVKALLPNFVRTTGIDAEITTRSIAQVYDTIVRDRKKACFDLYSVDLPWMQELVDTGQICCLDDFYRENEKAMSIYPEEILSKFARVNSHYYAVPFSFTSQLLFYRKDLFEEIRTQRYYFEEYGNALRVPQTWDELNRIARLFTKEIYPDSETKYGMTMCGSAFSGATCEFLPRLWSLGGSVFDEKGFFPNEGIFIKAIGNHLESFRYANPKSVNWWWDEQVSEFINGRAAMMVTFTEHAHALSEKKLSRIAGKYDVAVLPGRTSVLGGWSMAIRKGTDEMAAAEEFLRWISLRSLMETSAILGRVYPVTDEQSADMIDSLYEWFDTAIDSFRHAKARTYPDFIKSEVASTVRIEQILGQCIHRALLERMSDAEAFRIIRQQAEALPFYQ